MPHIRFRGCERVRRKDELRPRDSVFQRRQQHCGGKCPIAVRKAQLVEIGQNHDSDSVGFAVNGSLVNEEQVILVRRFSDPSTPPIESIGVRSG